MNNNLNFMQMNLNNMSINAFNNINNNLVNENNILKKQVEELQNKIMNSNDNNNINSNNNEIKIKFISSDHKIKTEIKCSPQDIFAKVEEKLYKIYPEFRETNNSFYANAMTIIKFKTIAENKLKDGDSVLLIKVE